jgi:hypothetical protein
MAIRAESNRVGHGVGAIIGKLANVMHFEER